MAGIGFELRKVLGKESLSSVFKVAVSGIMIVAGPWVLSIFGITAISRLAEDAVSEAHGLFMSSVIYCYAFSLIIFGGFHYIITRITADLVYEKKYDTASSVFILSSFVVFILSASAAAIFTFFIDENIIPYTFLFKISLILLFSVLNVLWVVMLFISLLKWYIKILVFYLIGMILAVVFVILLGKHYKSAGAMLGFMIGHLFIAGSLFFLSIKAYKPEKIFSKFGIIFQYLKKYKSLFFTGVFYYWGIWVDKVLYWFIRGEKIPHTFLRLYEEYDVLVYFSNLSMIPGLIFFVVISETGFYVSLMKLLQSLNKNRLMDIQKAKYEMVNGLKKTVLEQNIFQGILTFVIILSGSFLLGFLNRDPSSLNIFRVTLTAVFFHLIYLTLLNFLFYFELYFYTFLSSFIFFAINALSIFIFIKIPFFNTPGMSYLIAGVVSSIFSWIILYNSSKKIDRIIFSRY